MASDEERRERETRASSRMITMVQILFAVVLGDTLVVLQEVVLRPLTAEHRVAFLAMVAAYLTTIWSWIDWHRTAEMNPYRIASNDMVQILRRPFQLNVRMRDWETWRILPDVMIVVGYCYLMLSIQGLADEPGASILPFLFAYPLLFSLYLLAGMMRRISHGPLASRVQPIILGVIWFTVLALSYLPVTSGAFVQIETIHLNEMYLGIVIVVMIIYRFFLRSSTKKPEGNEESPTTADSAAA